MRLFVVTVIKRQINISVVVLSFAKQARSLGQKQRVMAAFAQGA